MDRWIDGSMNRWVDGSMDGDVDLMTRGVGGVADGVARAPHVGRNDSTKKAGFALEGGDRPS
jgi:hypothetical protein